jgi:hypothetical protein
MRSLLLVVLAVALMPTHAGAAQRTAEKSTAQRISGHLQESGQLRNYRIGVTYQNGVATLAGTVTSPEQRSTAIRLAKQIDGVKRVVCNLDCVAPAEGVAAGEEMRNEERQSTQILRPAAKHTAATADFQGTPSDVVQAYADGSLEAVSRGSRGQIQTVQQQRPALLPRSGNSNPNHRPRPLRRGGNMPLPAARTAIDPSVQQASAHGCYQAGGPYAEGYAAMGGAGMMGGPGMGAMPSGVVPTSYGRGPAYENPSMPGYAWPSYASYPNYAALSYPQQYSPTAWPYIGPFYPYPQVPLAWRKVSLEWDDGWWFLDFSAHNSSH